ncbi:MAG TPA: histidine phosphotransferase family protein [Xanthobacteraceae bacterium]|nr:histidine phosphotransferase family protein [Xanthobacteraceae bacterium]
MSELKPLEALDLAALLCSRVCHDVISPVGAIVNGLEIFEDEKDEAMKKSALDLVKKSANQASARLQFARIAFGAAGSAGAALDLGDAEKAVRGLLHDERLTIDWNLPRLLLPKNRVKVLLNLALVAGSSIPRGGRLTVDPIGEGEGMGFRLTAEGPYAKVQAAVEALLTAPPTEAVDAHAIQPHYTNLLAQNAALKISLTTAPERVVLSASAA